VGERLPARDHDHAQDDRGDGEPAQRECGRREVVAGCPIPTNADAQRTSVTDAAPIACRSVAGAETARASAVMPPITNEDEKT
jgi:hypothetical protein